MNKSINLDLWYSYHIGLFLEDELSKSEKKEIEANDFAMHLLMPTEAVINALGGEEEVLILFGTDSKNEIDKDKILNLTKFLAKKFGVPEKVATIKLLLLKRNLLEELKTKENKERQLLNLKKYWP